MPRPRVFISSTYYDLRHIRSSLDNFVESLGFEAILSEKGDIAYTHDRPLDESCYREVGTADIFVLVLGGRYGSAASDQDPNLPGEFFTRYDSITKKEYDAAAEKDIPIYILIDKAVFAEFQTYRRNRDNEEIDYAHVDSVNVFELIDDILVRPRNNPVQSFERFADIEEWLREQWAGLFRELLQARGRRQELRALSDQVAELHEINSTLKNYLEAVVRGVVPDQSGTLIRSEERRLESSRVLRELTDNPLISYLLRNSRLSDEEMASLIRRSANFEDFLRVVTDNWRSDEPVVPIQDWSSPGSIPFNDYNRARRTLGLAPLADVDRDRGLAHLATDDSLQTTFASHRTGAPGRRTLPGPVGPASPPAGEPSAPRKAAASARKSATSKKASGQATKGSTTKRSP